ncbi:hypothetical protein [Paraburkholderia sp. RL17-337-BIB-A]
MLQYECDFAGVWFGEVDEAYSTPTYNCCKRRPGPKGLEGFGIRDSACFGCGAYHHCGGEHSRGRMSQSGSRNPRPIRAQRGSSRLKSGRTSNRGL